ncbi:Folylpoly-gamma-glutamate synthetase [Dirofilaria immitis]|nr:Folylpoly-gamma-glutamate synthetase [Dirofilaria immitis]
MARLQRSLLSSRYIYFLVKRAHFCSCLALSVSRSLCRMAPESVSKMPTAYEESIARLNSLQNNAATIRKSLSNCNQTPNINHAVTKWCLEKCNIKLEEIDRLKIIHVSGTKGKGSTCAFTEAILRQLGFKTGFYSSPHLIYVRERIRINGLPLPEKDFVKYFRHIYSSLEKQSRKVDVAIIEVGIGGEYDCTNIIQNPVVCGVTTLDYDHTAMLGSTIESIAWHKAGIFKSGGMAIVSEQPKAAMQVLRKRAAFKNCLLRIAPPFNAYGWPLHNIDCGISGNHQRLNITLAFQLVKFWLDKVHKFSLSADLFKDIKNIPLSDSEMLPVFVVPQKFLDGIRLCHWQGRSQIIKRGSVTYYLDGAHTPKSLECCIKWFLNEKQKARRSWESDPFQILLFHCTSSRDPATFLSELSKYNFSLALFCPVRLNPVMDLYCDRANYTLSTHGQLAKVADHAAMWRNFNFADSTAEEFDCVQKAMVRIEKLGAVKNEIVVLVTGSLHLVGSVLTALDF